jgi:hypothetical protein
MNKPDWDELPPQEQLRYTSLMEQLFPNLSFHELEKKAQKYYESLYK